MAGFWTSLSHQITVGPRKKNSYILLGGQHAGLEFLNIESLILARKFKLAQTDLNSNFQPFVYNLVDVSAVCLHFTTR